MSNLTLLLLFIPSILLFNRQPVILPNHNWQSLRSATHLQYTSAVSIASILDNTLPATWTISLRRSCGPACRRTSSSIICSNKRDQIYETALAPDSGPNTTLFRTCTRIYDEAATLLYTLNPIDISLNGSYSRIPSSQFVDRNLRPACYCRVYALPWNSRGRPVFNTSGLRLVLQSSRPS